VCIIRVYPRVTSYSISRLEKCLNWTEIVFLISKKNFIPRELIVALGTQLGMYLRLQGVLVDFLSCRLCMEGN